jgi:protease I
LLRVEPKALALIKAVFDQKKIVAAVCHAPWLLIETGIAKGRKMTSYKSIKTDVVNAGAQWEDSEVVVDKGVITSRNPGDLEAFSAKIIEEIQEGRHTQRSAA